jgi:DNA invertase Pin-like site-specific DNA recombinase
MGKRTADPRIVVAYIRVSKDDQKLGPEAQRASIEAWARSQGVHVAAWHVDQGVCSVTPIDGRPGLCAALASLREHRAGVLVCAKRDRLSRDVVLTAMVERAAEACGARVVSAAGEGNGDTPADGFMRTVIDGAAAYERALIRARTKAALAAKARKGERIGGVPYGFRVAADGIHLEHDEHEQATIVTVRALASEGLSQRAIAAALAARGALSRAGRPFAQPQVCAMLAASK